MGKLAAHARMQFDEMVPLSLLPHPSLTMESALDGYCICQKKGLSNCSGIAQQDIASVILGTRQGSICHQDIHANNSAMPQFILDVQPSDVESCDSVSVCNAQSRRHRHLESTITALPVSKLALPNGATYEGQVNRLS